MIKMRKILILMLSFLLFQQCDDIFTIIERRKNEKASKRILDNTIEEMRKDYNLILDENKYEVKALGIMPGSVFTRLYYFGIREKEPVKYKSKYFKEYEGYYVFNGSMYDEEKWGFKFSKDLFGILSIGLRPYVLNEVLYDKTKGNNFEEIEKIFDESGYKIKANFGEYWRCGVIDEDIGGAANLNFVKDKKCEEEYYDEERHVNIRIGIKKYMEKFKEYFSIERNLETIDWEEYMKFNKIYPLLEFEIEGISEEELKKLRKKIKPYFNDKILYIKLIDTVKIVD